MAALLDVCFSKNSFERKRGATALEYAFIASLISVAIYAAAITIGTNLSATFNCVATKF